MTLEEHLANIKAQVNEGQTPTPTVRELLLWVPAMRRRDGSVKRIRDALKEAGLRTEPDFVDTNIDGNVKFLPAEVVAEPAAPGPAPGAASPTAPDQGPPEMPGAVAYSDPTYRISRLPTASRRPVTVTPDASIERAVTLMLANNFSQLPVMSGEREVKGVISWSSIGSRLARGNTGTTVQALMDQPAEIRADSHLFAAIPIVAEHGYVLVRTLDKRISGIVTASDLNDQFNQLAEPFLLLGEVENHIRSIIENRFGIDELQAVRDPTDADRRVESVSDLTFGEYVRLLENPARWEQLALHIDRAVFIEKLDAIRSIRNDVMHFDPDPLPPTDLQVLRDFVTFLHRLQTLDRGEGR